MTTALAKKKAASPKTKSTKSTKTAGTTKSTKSAETVTKSKSRARQPRKVSKSKKSGKKGGFFSCCAKKRKVKRSLSKKKGAKKLARSPSANKTAAGGKSTKSQKKSSKEKPTPPPPKSSLQKVADVKKLDTKTLPSSQLAKPSPLRSTSSEPLAPPPPPSSGTSTQATSSTPITTNTTSGFGSDMVTAPSAPLVPPTEPLAPPKSFSQEVGGASLPSPPRGSQECGKKYSKEESAAHEEEDSGEKKRIAYPSHKFSMTQYVKDECRVRRWMYEESTPLSMESNMKCILKTASSRLAQFQHDKDRRGDMMKDLNELSRILEG